MSRLVSAGNENITTVPMHVEKVSKRFGENQVLNNVSLDVKQGEIFGLIGLNGVGKTTLIKIILNLLSQDEGAVSFFGEPTATPASRRHISYLPEKFYPSPLLTGLEFLQLSLSYYGKKLDEEKAKQKAQILHLDPSVLKRRVSSYSKGMGQKLGLLSVFLAETPLFLLDEPMSGLDPQARIQLKDLLLEYKKAGHTIFFSSHILSDIEEICDRMSIIHAGGIIYSGEPKMFLKQSGEKSLERAFLKAIQA
jgi:ABC-2 type transport system ATP-binding protein